MSTDNILHLPEEISIANVGEWRNKLLEVLQSSPSINLDASDLCRIDMAAIQLLTVFVTEMLSAGKELKWQAHSETLNTTARQLELDQKVVTRSVNR